MVFGFHVSSVMCGCLVHCVFLAEEGTSIWWHSATSRCRRFYTNPLMEISWALLQCWRILNISTTPVTVVLWIVPFLQGRCCFTSGERSCSQFVSFAIKQSRVLRRVTLSQRPLIPEKIQSSRGQGQCGRVVKNPTGLSLRLDTMEEDWTAARVQSQNGWLAFFL